MAFLNQSIDTRHLRADLRQYFNFSKDFAIWRRSNRGEYRVLRCDFPNLMGWSELKRPDYLPRSIRVPNFAGGLDCNKAPLEIGKETMSRPHVHRLRHYKDTEDNHATLKKNGVVLNDDLPPIYEGKWGEIRIAEWRGRDGKELVVRMLNKSLLDWQKADKKMTAEICRLEGLGHPNFLAYYGSLESPFWRYHLFEYMPRRDLLTVIRLLQEQDRGLEDRVIKKIFLQVLYAVSHLHDKDLVHRTLKLENVLVDADWDVRLTSVRFLERTTAQNRGDPSNISRTIYNPEFGPRLYRSPERILKQPINPLLDQVWALGVMLYCLFFFKFPFKWPADPKARTCPEDPDEVPGFTMEVLEKVERGLRIPTGNDPTKVPSVALDLLRAIFVWEPVRPRTFELFEDPWLRLAAQDREDVEKMKGTNEISGMIHEEAEKIRNEPGRLLGLRRKMFKHFKIFREDYMRQPVVQATEMHRLEKTLRNARRHILPTTSPYGIFEVRENMVDYHKEERLYKEEYYPAMYQFNPIKCRYLGINRLYCQKRSFPLEKNLERLANKDSPKEYEPLPPKPKTGENEPVEPSVRSPVV